MNPDGFTPTRLFVIVILAPGGGTDSGTMMTFHAAATHDEAALRRVLDEQVRDPSNYHGRKALVVDHQQDYTTAFKIDAPPAPKYALRKS